MQGNRLTRIKNRIALNDIDINIYIYCNDLYCVFFLFHDTQILPYTSHGFSEAQ